MKPSFLNLFMKKFTRERVVPTISASISCDILGKHSLRPIFLAIARQQQQRARQPLLARVKQLIDQILFDSDVSRKHVRDEPIGELVFGMKDANHLFFFNHEYRRGRDRGRRSDPKRLAGEASLAKKIAGPKTATTASLPVSFTTESLTPPF